MKYSKPVVEIIKQRSSWRSYLPQPIEDQLKNQIIKGLREEKSSPLGGITRFDLIEMPELDPREKKRLGTYGFILGAQYFIVTAVQQSRYDLENLGYLLEEIILLATDLGLGTCWLGGTFKRSAFAEQMNIKEEERVPAITPVGYMADKRSIRDNIMRKTIKASQRRPWDELFFHGNFEEMLTKEAAGDYSTPLEMLRLAPSASNKQPWRILKEVQKNRYHFFIYRKKKTQISLLYDLPRIDLGIAICHFDLTSQELGLNGNWEFNLPSSDIPSTHEYLISWNGET